MTRVVEARRGAVGSGLLVAAILVTGFTLLVVMVVAGWFAGRDRHVDDELTRLAKSPTRARKVPDTRVVSRR